MGLAHQMGIINIEKWAIDISNYSKRTNRAPLGRGGNLFFLLLLFSPLIYKRPVSPPHQNLRAASSPSFPRGAGGNSLSPGIVGVRPLYIAAGITTSIKAVPSLCRSQDYFVRDDAPRESWIRQTLSGQQQQQTRCWYHSRKKAAARPSRPIELETATELAPAISTGDELVLPAVSPAGVAVEPPDVESPPEVEPPDVESPPVLLPEPVPGVVVPASPALVLPPAELAGTALAAFL